MIDIHAHLCFPEFDSIREKVIAECRKRMEGVIVGSARHDEGLCALRLCAANDKLFPTLGYHPTEGGPDPGRIMEMIRANQDKIVGVGEVGLDYHWEHDRAKREVQRRVFAGFIELAKELGKPLLIHSWDAEPECFAMVRDVDVPVIFHCFSGSRELAGKILEAGFYISFSTQVLFSKNHKKLAKVVPLQRMTLETDAPFLSPHRQMQGPGKAKDALPGFDPKLNYPWNIALSAEKIGGIKGVTPLEVLHQTALNAKRIFGIS